MAILKSPAGAIILIGGRAILFSTTAMSSGGTGGTTPPVVTAPPVTAPPPAVGTPGAPPSRLTGVTWTQPYPIHPNASDASTVGYFDPVGGIGPFRYAYTVTRSDGNNDSNKYGFRDDGPTSVLSVFGESPGELAQTLAVTCTDGRGDKVSKTFPIVKAAASALVITANTRNPANTAFGYNYDPSRRVRVDAAGGSHSFGNDTITFSGPNGSALPGGFTESEHGCLAYATIPPPGSYPVEVHATDSTGNALTLSYVRTFVAPTPIDYIEMVPGVVSTSMTAGSAVGQACATTPNNNPAWAIYDASGTFQISVTGIVAVKQTPTTAGPVPFSITVSDGSVSFTQSFSINVVQGTTIAPSAMTLALSTTLDNGSGSIGKPVTTAPPAVTGITGTPTWSLVQDNWNALALQRGSLNYLYRIDPATGVITVNSLLMAKTHKLVISVTDGLNTCTKPFTLPVAWAPTTRTIYVGAGMAAAHGADGYEHFGVAIKEVNRGARATTTQINIMAHADENYYAEDNGVQTNDGNAGFAICGPVIITGVSANGREQPRMGGHTSKWSSTGFNARYGDGKGFMVCGDGDAIIENLEFSHCFGGAQTRGIEAIRKDGETYGNLTVRYCRISNSDNGIETGFGASDLTIYGNEIVGCGTSHVSAGACHNFYIGQQWSCDVHDNFSAMSMTGHDYKARAFTQKVYNNRFYDLSRGGGSNCVNLPNGGDVEMYGNKFQKGTMAGNPFVVQFGESFNNSDEFPGAIGQNYTIQRLNLHDNEISVLTLDGAHFGTPAVLRHWLGTDYTGRPSVALVTNNRVYRASDPHSFMLSTGSSTNNPPTYNTPDDRTVETGTVVLSTPPEVDFTRPHLSGTMPRFGWYRIVNQYGDSLSQYDDNQIDPGFDDLRFSTSTGPNTALSTMAAHAQMDDFNGTPAQPFGAGTAWELSRDQVFYDFVYPSTPWAAPGLFTLIARPDGSATFALGNSAVPPGTYYVQPKATAPNGAVVKNRFAVVVF